MIEKNTKSKYYVNLDDYKNDPEFYEEWTALFAQEKIAELMEEQNITKAELAKRLGQSKAHVTGLLSEGRNLTLKTFGRVCFHLNASVKSLEMSLINENVKIIQRFGGYFFNNNDSNFYVKESNTKSSSSQSEVPSVRHVIENFKNADGESSLSWKIKDQNWLQHKGKVA